MKRQPRHLVLASLVFPFLLVACGGGSDDGPPSPSVAPAKPKTQQNALQLRTEKILGLNPSLLASDTLETTVISSGPPERLAPLTCRTRRCSHPLLEGDIGIDEAFDATEVERLGTHRGVMLGVWADSQPETDEAYGLDVLSLGGWLDESMFGVEVLVQGGYAFNTRYSHSYSLGAPSRSNPLVGNATWKGMMIGTSSTERSSLGAVYEGDATLTVSFVEEKMNVLFDNILETLEGGSESGAYPDIAWNDVPMVNGAFVSDTQRLVREAPLFYERIEGTMIEGRFYGSSHAEVGGIFETEEVLGAFGAKR